MYAARLPHVHVCSQTYNVRLDAAQQAIAADWDTKLRTVYLATSNVGTLDRPRKIEEWLDPAFSFFASVVGGTTALHRENRIESEAQSRLLPVVGLAPAASGAKK